MAAGRHTAWAVPRLPARTLLLIQYHRFHFCEPRLRFRFRLRIGFGATLRRGKLKGPRMRRHEGLQPFGQDPCRVQRPRARQF